MLLAISATADNARGPRFMEQALAAIHAGNSRRLPVVFAYGSTGPTVGLFCRLPRSLKPLVLGQLAAAYPDCRFQAIPEDALDRSDRRPTWSAELRLAPDLFPIRRHPQFEDALTRTTSDPMSGILASLSVLSSCPLRPRVEIHVRPARGRRRRRLRRAVDRLARPFFRERHVLAFLYASVATDRVLWPLAPLLGFPALRRDHFTPLRALSSRSHDHEQELDAAADKLGRHLFSVQIRIVVRGPPGADHQARAIIHSIAGAFGQFTSPRLATFRLGHIRCRPVSIASAQGRGGFFLSDEELATLVHPATETVRAERMERNTWRQAEPPPVIPSGRGGGEAVLGRLAYRSRRDAFGMKLDDRRRHLVIVGKTGMGKSTLLQNLVTSDIAAGHGVGLVDPHGDLAEAILELVPRQRTNDIVLLDAGDRANPVAFNPLACNDPTQRSLVVSGIVSAFKKLYGESWGPRMEHILRNALLTLIAVPGASLLSLLRLLADKGYREAILRTVADPVVRSFWIDEFGSWSERYRTEALAPVQNKLGHFLSSPVLRAITGQARSTIDLRRIMDRGQVLLVNLSKGRTGEDASALLGALLVTSIQQAAMSRADVPEAARRDFFLYVDEFQNFATDSFATILSEARKYRLSLTLAHQFLAQLPEATAAAVFGNVGSLVSFQVGPQDAETLVEQLGGDLQLADLVALPRFTAYVRLLLDGMPTRPFSMETLPPRRPPRDGRSEKVRLASTHRYGRPLPEVEREIAAAMAA